MVRSGFEVFEKDVKTSTIVGQDGVYLNVTKEDSVVWSTTVPFSKIDIAKAVQTRVAKKVSSK